MFDQIWSQGGSRTHGRLAKGAAGAKALSKYCAQCIQGPALGTADHGVRNKERNPGGWEDGAVRSQKVQGDGTRCRRVKGKWIVHARP